MKGSILHPGLLVGMIMGEMGVFFLFLLPIIHASVGLDIAADYHTKCMLLHRLALKLNLIKDVPPGHDGYFGNNPCGLHWKDEVAVKALREAPTREKGSFVSYDERLDSSKMDMLVIQNVKGSQGGPLSAELMGVSGRRMRLVGAIFQDLSLQTRALIREDEGYAEVVFGETWTIPIQLFYTDKKTLFNQEASLLVNEGLIGAVDFVQNIIFNHHYLFYQDAGPMEETIDIGDLALSSPSRTPSLHHHEHEHAQLFLRQQSICLIRLIQLLKYLYPGLHFVSKELQEIAAFAEIVKMNDAPHLLDSDLPDCARSTLLAAQSFFGRFAQDRIMFKPDPLTLYLDMVITTESEAGQLIIMARKGHVETNRLNDGIEPLVAFQVKNQDLTHDLFLEVGDRKQISLSLCGIVDCRGQLTVFKRHANLLEVAHLGSKKQVYNFKNGEDGNHATFFAEDGIAFYKLQSQ